MNNDTPQLLWAKRFSLPDRLFLALYFCGIPILLSCALIYSGASQPGYGALLLSVLGAAWVIHRFGQRRYAITDGTVDADLAPIGRWTVGKQQVMLHDVLFASVKPSGIKVYSNVIIYHRGDGPPVAFDFLSNYEALAASKTIGHYCEIKKAESAEPTPEAEHIEPISEPTPETTPEPISETISEPISESHSEIIEADLENHEVSPETFEVSPDNSEASPNNETDQEMLESDQLPDETVGP
jgi:hypothetical protein